MGKNGAGKTTLLTNIGTGNIEGLPTSLKTVYVQHDDASEDGGVSLIDELVSSKEMVLSNVKKADAIAALKNINFTDTMLGMLSYDDVVDDSDGNILDVDYSDGKIVDDDDDDSDGNIVDVDESDGNIADDDDSDGNIIDVVVDYYDDAWMDNSNDEYYHFINTFLLFHIYLYNYYRVTQIMSQWWLEDEAINHQG
jgi:hypothetical protein